MGDSRLRRTWQQRGSLGVRRLGADMATHYLSVALIRFPKSFFGLHYGSLSGVAFIQKGKEGLRMSGASGTICAFGQVTKGFVLVSADSFSDQF